MLNVFAHRRVFSRQTLFWPTLALCFLCSLFLVVPKEISAATLSEGISGYESGDFAKAAAAFLDVVEHDSQVGDRQHAEYYLGKSLSQLGYAVPALYYYKTVFQTGRSHKFYVQATADLIDFASTFHDDFLVPSILSARFDAESFEKLDPDKVNTINYMIGALSYRQGKLEDATSFLSAVVKSASVYLKARYFLGVLKVKKNDNVAAIGLWQEIIDDTSSNEDDGSEQKKLRDLAFLGQARAYYALGNFEKAVERYRLVPRYSDEWFDALAESGWAYFQQEDYGRALGQIESVLSPYFNKRFRPEAFVLAATVYYSNCQWDRTRTILETFEKHYEPALDQLKAYLASGRKDGDFYNDLVTTSANIPIEVLRQVRRNGRVLNLYRLVAETEREQESLSKTDNLGGHLGAEIKQLLGEQRANFSNLAGSLIKKGLTNEASLLTQFVNQGRIVKLETVSSEKEILEAGGNIDVRKRRRLPRPDIASDQTQMWNFGGEFWVDELGYYVHGVRKECVELGAAQ